jgi:hypothetical protein
MMFHCLSNNVLYLCKVNKAQQQKANIMTYFERIELELQKGQTIMNDSNPDFTWTTFTRGGLKQIFLYKGEDFEIKEYKTLKSLSIAVGKLLNGIY